MKGLQIALLFVACFAAAQASNAYWGSRNSTDVWLSSDFVYRNGTVNQYSSVELSFPKPGQGNTRVITAIYVYDGYTNGKGATASLWSGGPGYTFASINFKSQYGQGVNSTVEIYGRK